VIYFFCSLFYPKQKTLAKHLGATLFGGAHAMSALQSRLNKEAHDNQFEKKLIWSNLGLQGKSFLVPLFY